MGRLWIKGRGKLGMFDPLIGAWVAEETSGIRGPVRCERTLQRVLGGSYVEVKACWRIGAADTMRTYEEIALIGAGDDGSVQFWSFTSDGKRSQGVVAVVSDLHPEAVGFEAEMPAGRARFAYWPEQGGGFHFVVESATRKGWNRFVHHLYKTVPQE